ncbi:response regulator [Desulfoluna butyratoxydans]|uniref:Signal transduction response regulator receiver domain n=1 Tax=Desulfoluna butyratoxydans TaxID=231438 RepID=A0A4U8YSF5_9BACT|nr:response regulator [Desulfoluna butyratoxydans]VFQ46694.1 signal transduction response regulator receiver domain [Desulfoluna butyratoxydans]
MVRQILVVDDNQPFLNLIHKLFSKLKDRYAVLTCTDGGEAVELLKRRPIALVVTDLQMPNVDGYGLLEKIRRFFPDVPAIVVTSFDKPKTREAVMRYGARAYFTKPLVVEDLVRTIDQIFKEQAGGGTLKNASLEMFLQLIEMEAKTCTIRVVNEMTGTQGVLFFRDGDILNARYGPMTGNKAAYRVLGWERVTLLIENSCVLTRKGIQGELQAILLDAMRLKDEMGSGSPGQVAEQGGDASSGDPVDGARGGSPDELERLAELVVKASGNPDAVEAAAWAPELADKMAALQMFGNILGAGPLKAVLSNRETDQRMVVMGAGVPARLVVGAKVQKESLIDAVLDV